MSAILTMAVVCRHVQTLLGLVPVVATLDTHLPAMESRAMVRQAIVEE